METNRPTGGDTVITEVAHKSRTVEPQGMMHGMHGMMDRMASPVGMAGMPFGWVFAFMVFAFCALMAAFYCGHKFSAPQVVYQAPAGQTAPTVTQQDLKRLLEEASKSKGLDAGMINEKFKALSAGIDKLEKDFGERANLLSEMKNEIIDGRKVIMTTMQGMLSSTNKGATATLDVAQTFDGEFKTVDARFAEVATLLASIRDKQSEVANLRKIIGDGNDASKIAISQLSERLNGLNEGVTQLVQVVRTKLPNPDDLKFGAEFPPPTKNQ